MVATGVKIPTVLAVVLCGMDLRPIGQPTARRGVGELLLNTAQPAYAGAGGPVGRFYDPVVDVGQCQPILRSFRVLPRIPFSPPFPQSVGQYHRTFFVSPENVVTTIRSLSLLTGRWQWLHSICFISPSVLLHAP